MIKKIAILVVIIGLFIPISSIKAEETTGWYGEYFNYPISHQDMDMPQRFFPDNNHGDPLGSWDTDWYDDDYLRFSQYDQNLNFGTYFPFDNAMEENHGGHDRYFGMHWKANISTNDPGQYNFVITSDDDSWVYFDGELIVDNSGVHGATMNSASVNITSSNHIIEVYYADRNEFGASIYFSFTNENDLSITPNNTPSNDNSNDGNDDNSNDGNDNSNDENNDSDNIDIPPSNINVYTKPTGIIVATSKWEEPYVKVYDREGTFIREFLVYEKDYLGGINLAVEDITLDGKVEIIVGPAEGRLPEVRIFSTEGILINSFMAYDENFGGGVNVAVGDVDGDGTKEIITGAGVGGHLVKVFTYENGTYKLLTDEFSAYNYNYLLGVKVAVGDLDGDGKGEIITGTESGGGPHVRVFDGHGNLKFSPGFFAYREDLRHGIKVAAGDLDKDGRDEIITGTNIRMGPHVRVFDPFGNIKLTPGFFAYDKGFRGGVNVAVADLDLDGRDEIITGAGPGGGPHVRIFNRFGDTHINSGFFAFPEDIYRSGVQVGGGVIQ